MRLSPTPTQLARHRREIRTRAAFCDASGALRFHIVREGEAPQQAPHPGDLLRALSDLQRSVECDLESLGCSFEGPVSAAHRPLCRVLERLDAIAQHAEGLA